MMMKTSAIQVSENITNKVIQDVIYAIKTVNYDELISYNFNNHNETKNGSKQQTTLNSNHHDMDTFVKRNLSQTYCSSDGSRYIACECLGATNGKRETNDHVGESRSSVHDIGQRDEDSSKSDSPSDSSEDIENAVLNYKRYSRILSNEARQSNAFMTEAACNLMSIPGINNEESPVKSTDEDITAKFNGVDQVPAKGKKRISKIFGKKPFKEIIRRLSTVKSESDKSPYNSKRASTNQ